MQMTLKTFLKHFSDCLFYFCSTCADSIIEERTHLPAEPYTYCASETISHISPQFIRGIHRSNAASYNTIAQ